MKKITKSLTILLTLIMVAVVFSYPLLAWFIMPRTNLFVVVGDINISVRGWYKVVSMDEVSEEISFDEIKDELDDIQNMIPNLESNQFVAFRFEIVNLSEKAASLNMKLSPFSEVVFENFSSYYDLYTRETPPTPQEITGIESAIHESAKANTAKLAFNISDIQYSNSATMVVSNTSKSVSLWKYSAGEYIFDKPVSLSGKKLNENNEAEYSPVNLFFRMVKSQSSINIDEYRKWLCGEDKIVSYSQERCAQSVGYTYTATGLHSQLVDSYLSLFINSEISSINIRDEDELSSELNLDLKYFEFAGINGLA